MSIELAPGQSKELDVQLHPVAPGGAGIWGFITWRWTEEPIAGATVSIAGKTAVTGANGYFEIHDIPVEMSHEIIWAHPDAWDVIGWVFLRDGDWRDMSRELEPREVQTASLHGTVYGYDEEYWVYRPLPNATVSVIGQSTLSDAQGKYEIHDIIPGPHTISASCPGYIPRNYPWIDFYPGENKPFDIHLHRE